MRCSCLPSPGRGNTFPHMDTTQHWNRFFDLPAIKTRSLSARRRRVQLAAARFLGIGPGARVLDVGCGMGEDALFFASLGADVTAIDNSTTAIERLVGRVADAELKNVRPLCMDVFDLAGLGQFDAVYGMMILHHVEPLGDFVDILHRVVTPQGRAFFFENSASNRLLMWCREHLTGRFGIPKQGDAEEQPLSDGEIDLLRRYFQVRVDRRVEFMLMQLMAIYLTGNYGERVAAALDRLVRWVPGVLPLSYRQVVLLQR